MCANIRVLEGVDFLYIHLAQPSYHEQATCANVFIFLLPLNSRGMLIVQTGSAECVRLVKRVTADLDSIAASLFENYWLS